MPPKKKQQEIDLSTLPQCVSSNSMLYCVGKKSRAEKILTKIQQDLPFISKINRQQVLDHAKDKNIYIDPATLNDKQKKDPKFMESISTELTPQVIAKATKSLIETLKIKIRLEMKAQNEKPEQQRAKPSPIEKRFHQLYNFEDFPEAQQDFEALAEANENIKYVLCLKPVISWANAPELPDQEEKDQDAQQQEDEDIKQFKDLQKKQALTQEDQQFQSQITKRVQSIRSARQGANASSKFRDCIIQMVHVEIDPYNEELSIAQAVKTYHSRLSKLSMEYEDFLDWKKDKVLHPIIKPVEPVEPVQDVRQPQQGQNVAEQRSDDAKQKPISEPAPPKVKAQGVSTIQILTNFVNGIFSQNQTAQPVDQTENLIFNFNFESLEDESHDQDPTAKRRQKNSEFCLENENYKVNQDRKFIQEQSRSNLQYPGLNRYLMPQIPAKSQGLRKLGQSHYAQFLKSGLQFQEFQRQQSLSKFQELLKESDEDRSYRLDDRVYCENHDEKSLMRELYRAMSLNEGHFLTRYNEDNDKLYVALLYKNNQRRLHNKQWEANWKVLPNYESWLKHFRQNESNLSTQDYYDIDYEKIGHIDDQTHAFSVPDGGVVIRKQSKVANSVNTLLYAIKNHHLFGINSDAFYSENQNTKVFHYASKRSQQTRQADEQADKVDSNSSYQTSILISEQMRLRLLENGDIIVEKTNAPRHTYSADGYTIINKSNSQYYEILHPNGGISTPSSYTNEKGFGMLNGQIHNTPTLLRKTQSYNIIKRDDETVIVESQQKKWVKFHQGTQYLIQKSSDQIQIEKKGMPFITSNNRRIKAEINGIVITGQPSQGGSYKFTIKYQDGNQLNICGSQVQVTQLVSPTIYKVNVKDQEMRVQISEGQQITANFEALSYRKGDKQLNPLQSEQNYDQNESLPEDYLPPKLFMISPDNTGVQFLSDDQLHFYFKSKDDEEINTIRRIPHKSADNQTIHVVSRIVQNEELNPKRILPGFDINLDIFKTEKYFKEKTILDKYTVRSLIKHRNLLPEDHQEIDAINQKKQAWVKQVQKDLNQFGAKPKGDPLIQKNENQKKIMIDFRRKQPAQIDFQMLKEEAISEWKYKQKQHMTMVAKEEEQNIIRNRMNQRKTSMVSAYPPIVIKPKQQNENTQNYSPAGCYKKYAQTAQGKKALSEMPDWVFRPKTAKQKRQLDPEIVSELNNTLNKTKEEKQVSEQNNERYDTVDVNLNPQRQIYIKPSVFTQRQIDQERSAFQEEKKAYFYHEKKRKDFNVYGSERPQKPQVKSLLRTQPISQINQKYLITEAPLDRKVKISSMKNKLTSNASSLVEMRKEGPHNTLLRTLDKRNDYSQLLEKRTMMVHADLNDKLQRDILITPIEANFGYLKEGRTYEVRLNVKNEDILAQRLVLKKPRNVVAKVQMSQMGPIALGMSRKVIVQLKASSEYMGKYVDEFEIVSKHEIYKIPINAVIISQGQFEGEGYKLSLGVRQVQEPLKRKSSGLPPIN